MLADLVAYLKANVAAVGNRVYPAPLPQGATKPALTYWRVDDIPTYGYAGDLGLNTARVQLDIWADTLASIETVKGQLKSALSGFRGQMGSTTVGGAFLLDFRDALDAESGTRRGIMDVQINYVGG